MMTKFFAKRSDCDDQYVIGLNRVKERRRGGPESGSAPRRNRFALLLA